MSIKLADIARKTGTSISSVSAALKGNRSTAKVSETTRQRILAEAERLGYRPSHAARALKVGRTGVFGYITGEIHTPHFGEMATLLMEEAEKHRFSVQMYVTRWKPERGIRALDQLLDGRCDGLIIQEADVLNNHPSAADYIRRHHFPTVLLNHTRSGFPSVCEEWSSGFRAAVRDLRERGIDSAAFLGHKVGITARPKLKALIDACTEAATTLRLVECDLSPEQARDYGLSLRDASVRPRVIFTENDALAMPLLKGLAEAGLRVPGEIGVIGYDDTMLSRYSTPTMATIGFDKNLMVERTIAVLTAMLDSGAWSAEAVQIPTTFIHGESV